MARAFKERYGIVWLDRSPMNDSQGLATTREIAKAQRLATLSDAGALRRRVCAWRPFRSFSLAPTAFPDLQRFYGGFRFGDVRTYDIALKYRALLEGKADIATAFTTDGAIAAYDLVILRDDRHFWPPYNIAPLVRKATLRVVPADRDPF